jgi:hypothetical protein
MKQWTFFALSAAVALTSLRDRRAVAADPVDRGGVSRGVRCAFTLRALFEILGGGLATDSPYCTNL